MKCLTQVYAPRLHPGVLAVKAAGMKLQKRESTESSLLLSPQTGSSQAAPHKNTPKQYQSYVSAGNDSTGRANIQLCSFQPGWILCAATRGNQKTEKESGSSTHLGCHHTLVLSLYQLFFQTAETCRHSIMGYPKDTTEPCVNQWPRWARMTSQTLFDASPPLLTSVLCFTGQWLGHTHTPVFLVVSVSFPLAVNSQTHLPSFLPSSSANSSSYMPATALSPASTLEHSCIPHVSSLTLRSGKQTSPFLHVTVQNMVVDLFNLNSSAGFSAQDEVQT